MMDDKELEQEERAYKRYLQEGAHPQDREEIRAFRLYARIRHQLHHAQAPQYSQKDLLTLMVKKMEETPERRQGFPMASIRTGFPLSAVYTGVAVVCLLICANLIRSVDWDLAPRVQLTSEAGDSVDTPLIWHYRLLSGKRVAIPPGWQATLHLSDGSRLECQENTQLAVRYTEARTISLYAGKVTIHANKNQKAPMFVKTPLGEIQVTGTVFSVELVRSTALQNGE